MTSAALRAEPAAGLPSLTLVLGGARSGKSAYAESVVAGHAAPVYLATCPASSLADDAEMAERIRRHRERRGDAWTTVEEPLDLIAAIAAHRRPGAAILVDCATLWLSNLMAAERDVDAEGDRLAAALAASAPDAAPVVVVASEVGFGIVPDNALARRFRDHAGRLNQRLAAVARRVVLVAAGIPLVIKETS